MMSPSVLAEILIVIFIIYYATVTALVLLTFTIGLFNLRSSVSGLGDDETLEMLLYLRSKSIYYSLLVDYYLDTQSWLLTWLNSLAISLVWPIIKTKK